MRIYTENGVDDLMDYRDPIKPNRLNVKVIREMSALEAKDGRCIAMLPYEVAIVDFDMFDNEERGQGGY